MINNFFFLLKIIRIFKAHDILRLIGQNVRYRIIYTIITQLFSIGVSKNKELVNDSDGVRIAKALNELGPSFVKLGQLISTRPDIVGNTIADDLSILRDNLPPFSKDIAIKIVESEFGTTIDKVFTDFSEPIAAASIAQVHFAKINNNGIETEVAVKILRPQIEKIIEQEMSRLEWLTSFMENFKEFERLRPNSIIKKAKEVIKFELDLRYEAAAASELRENTQFDGSFYVPLVYWEKITQKILTMEKINGIPADKIEKLNENNYCLLYTSPSPRD